MTSRGKTVVQRLKEQVEKLKTECRNKDDCLHHMANDLRINREEVGRRIGQLNKKEKALKNAKANRDELLRREGEVRILKQIIMERLE